MLKINDKNMNQVEIEKISSKIKDVGFVTLNNFLDNNKLNAAKNVCNKIFNKQIAKHNDNKDYPIDTKSLFIKLAKFDFIKVKDSFILKKIANDLKLKKISEKTFESDVELCMIDSYYSVKTEKFDLTNYWHCYNVFFDRTCLEKNSTLGYESFARGSKTVFFSLRHKEKYLSTLKFGWPAKLPNKGFFWTDCLSENYCNRMLVRVISANNTKWNMVRKRYKKQLIENNPNNVKFNSLLKKIIRNK